MSTENYRIFLTTLHLQNNYLIYRNRTKSQIKAIRLQVYLMVLGFFKNEHRFSKDFLQKVPKRLVVLLSSWLISHMYILKLFS